LLHARCIVDALVNRCSCKRQAADSSLDKERTRATKSQIPESYLFTDLTDL